jgi:peptide/nickel transport system ATP-binding protein/Fe3+-transporting ATPase
LRAHAIAGIREQRFRRPTAPLDAQPAPFSLADAGQATGEPAPGAPGSPLLSAARRCARCAAAGSGASMLSAEGLGFRYGPRLPRVVRDLSLAVAPGEVVGLSGPSGRGKTTLARLLAGFRAPTAGRVLLDGRPLPAAGYCPVQLIFQHPELAINPRWRIGRVLAEGDPAGEELLASLGVEPGWRDRWPHELSGGELQRVAVARALGARTRYALADEMTAMLDAGAQAQIWGAVLAHARARGLGLLIISHSAPLVERLCDRVIALPEPPEEADAAEASRS